MKEQDIIRTIQNAIEHGASLTMERHPELIQGHCQFIGHISWPPDKDSIAKVDRALHMSGDSVMDCLENLVWKMANEFISGNINRTPKIGLFAGIAIPQGDIR